MIKRLTATTLTAALTFTLTACDNESSGSATPPPFTPSTVPPATASATPTESPGVVAAVEAYRKFIAATDVMAASGGEDVSELRKWASGAMLGAELNQAATFKGKKWRSAGRQRIVWAKILTRGTPGPNGQINEAVVEACVDASQAIATGPDGKPVRPADAPTQLIDRMKMVHAAGGWKANFPQSRKAGTC